MKPSRAHVKYGYTNEVSQAISVINANKIRSGSRGQESICKMIGMLFAQRHRLGIEHATKRFKILKTALHIIKNEQ